MENRVAGQRVTSYDVSEKTRWAVVVVPLISLLASSVIMAFEPRFGLLPVALVLGWTQWVGL
jgi:hypothetical protein